MRVAVVTSHPIQYQVPWFRRLSARAGMELHVFFAMVPGAEEQGREFGVAFAWDIPMLDGYHWTLLPNVARTPSLTRFGGCDTPQLYQELRRDRFDAVIVNGWVVKSCVQALVACRLRGIPCIVRGEANGLRPRASWKRAMHRVLLAQYSRFLAIGTRNRDYYLDSGVDPSRIYDTPYCVDNERFSAAAAEQLVTVGREALCTRYGLDPAVPTFLFCGKLVEKKRPADVIEATRIAVRDGCRLQVLVVGDGPLLEGLRRNASNLPVRFAGFMNQSEIASAYALADCLVLPSDHGETWGLVVNEGMACGRPAILSDQVGAAVDLVVPEVTGAVYPCGDVMRLAGLLVAFVRCPGSLREMGDAARLHVTTNFTMDRVVDGVCDALASLPTGTRAAI